MAEMPLTTLWGVKTMLDRSLSRFPRPVRTAIDWALTLLVAVAVVLVFEAEVAKPYEIPTSSMEPTLHCARPGKGCRGTFSDRVLVNRLAYRFRGPRRGDVVVFEAPTKALARCGAGGAYVKRIVGLPGETVRLADGDVSIDGKPLDDNAYIRSRAQRGVASGSWKVPAGRYFLLGDNRIDSCDSRTWGSVARSSLIGPVVATYWPPERIRIDH
jgi:signal peptidase I